MSTCENIIKLASMTREEVSKYNFKDANGLGRQMERETEFITKIVRKELDDDYLRRVASRDEESKG